jgi:mRNA interferase MazF
MSVGDIHWVELPPANGHEQRGRRPAIIIQDDEYAVGLPTSLVVPLSTARRALRFAGTTLIRATSRSGLRTDSVALVFQCRAIDRKRIREQMGAITDEERTNLIDELQKLTGQKR